MALRNRAPGWFWVVAVLLTLWGALGVWAFYADVTMSAATKAQLSAYDRALLASRPAWFPWLYGASVWGGLLGSVALLARSKLAYGLYIVSLVSMVVMFGYIFVATDLIAVKGVGTATGFPIFIFVIAGAQIWVARLAIRRGWIG